MDLALPAVLTHVRRHVDAVYHALLSADHGRRSLGSGIRPLLRSLSGKLHFTSLLAEELVATLSFHDPQLAEAKGNRAHLVACDSALDDLSSLLERNPSALDVEACTSSVFDVLRALQVQLDLASHATSLLALERCLSNSPSLRLPKPTVHHLGSSQSDPIHGPQTYQESLDAFSRALEVILHPQFSTRITSYHEYLASVKARAGDCHDEYRKSAVLWPGYAEEFWPQCKHLITQLFHPEKSPNFELWILEYCRQQWPEVYGDRALTPAHTLRLLSTVAESSFSPLHAAAALGLAQLCEHLIGLGSDPRQCSPIGTPLYCSFIGPKAFLADTEHVTLLAQLPCSSVAQAETIDLFTRRTVIRCVSETAPSAALAEPFPLSTLAFHTCLRLGAHESFLRMVPYLDLDDGFWDMLTSSEFEDVPWAKHPSQKAWTFLNSVLPGLYDFHAVRYEELERPSLLEDMLLIMDRWKLDMVKDKPRYCQRIADIDDQDFQKFVRDAVQLHEREVVFRLIRDPRWDPNTPGYGSTEGPPGTILHMAVGDEHLELMRDLLDAGADVHARDHRGQTPILTAESAEALELLVKYGADTRDTDELGYNIWHIAAANNDTYLLEWLLIHDPNQEVNRAACMKNGQTPIARAMTYPLENLRHTVSSFESRGRDCPYAAALLLLSTSKGRPSFVQGPTPALLPHAAAEWGSLTLASALLGAGEADMAEVDDQGNSALHSLNFAATEDLVAFLQSQGAPEVNAHGQTPAETIFFAYAKGYPPPDLDFPMVLSSTSSEHPACSRDLDALAYNRLLTPAVLASRDAQGRGLWERFICDIVHAWAYSPPRWMMRTQVATSLVTATKCLIKHGAAAVFEQEKGQRALEHFLHLTGTVPKPDWFSDGTSRETFADIVREIIGMTNDFSPLPTDVFFRCLHGAVKSRQSWVVPVMSRLDQPFPEEYQRVEFVPIMMMQRSIGHDTFRHILDAQPVDLRVGRLALDYLVDLKSEGYPADFIRERRTLLGSWMDSRESSMEVDDCDENDATL